MSIRIILFYSLMITVATGLLAQVIPKTKKTLAAPTYYMAIEARNCDKKQVRFSGASNLPPGAIIRLTISDFSEDAWRQYSDEVYATVDDKGFFEGAIAPKQGMTFRRNLILDATFTPFKPTQPLSVLNLVGERGQNLGGIYNPQVGQLSGEDFYLDTIARVPWCGEGLKSPR